MSENTTVISVKYLTAEFIGRDIAFTSYLGNDSQIEYEVRGLLMGFAVDTDGITVVLTAPSWGESNRFTEKFYLDHSAQVKVYYANVPF